ncbi:MAG TPA: sigma-70 family RNA polymerase sigma factor [Phnomibacter sp.]|nr:sigma-70 family RNA polymerase sigma factor [Phnomibacter sp.]
MKEYSKERKLLQGLALNDSRDIDTIYRENFGLVQTFITQNNGTFDDARDVFQEAMLVLYEKSKDPEFSLTCQIKTYLYSICRRLWLKRLQQQNRYSHPVEGFEDLVPVEEEIEAKEKLDNDFDTMENAMRNLGEPCKSLLEAFYIQKKQMVDIADEFGYTNADNAKNQKYKCLMRLKKLFFAQYSK